MPRGTELITLSEGTISSKCDIKLIMFRGRHQIISFALGAKTLSYAVRMQGRSSSSSLTRLRRQPPAWARRPEIAESWASKWHSSCFPSPATEHPSSRTAARTGPSAGKSGGRGSILIMGVDINNHNIFVINIILLKNFLKLWRINRRITTPTRQKTLHLRLNDCNVFNSAATYLFKVHWSHGRLHSLDDTRHGTCHLLVVIKVMMMMMITCNFNRRDIWILLHQEL